MPAARKPDSEKIRELYLAAFSREPAPQELQTNEEYLAKSRTESPGKPDDLRKTTREAYEDILWALINTKDENAFEAAIEFSRKGGLLRIISGCLCQPGGLLDRSRG